MNGSRGWGLGGGDRRLAREFSRRAWDVNGADDDATEGRDRRHAIRHGGNGDARGRRPGDARKPVSPEDRARRYLTGGRVTVQRVDTGRVLAACRGFRGVYWIAREPGLGWACSCSERGRCAHILAVQLVTEEKS